MSFDKIVDLTAGVYFKFYNILHFTGYCVSAKNCFLHPGSFLNIFFLKAGSTVSILFRVVFGHPCNTQVGKVPVLWHDEWFLHRFLSDILTFLGHIYQNTEYLLWHGFIRIYFFFSYPSSHNVIFFFRILYGF